MNQDSSVYCYLPVHDIESDSSRDWTGNREPFTWQDEEGSFLTSSSPRNIRTGSYPKTQEGQGQNSGSATERFIKLYASSSLKGLVEECKTRAIKEVKTEHELVKEKCRNLTNRNQIMKDDVNQLQDSFRQIEKCALPLRRQIFLLEAEFHEYLQKQEVEEYMSDLVSMLVKVDRQMQFRALHVNKEPFKSKRKSRKWYSRSKIHRSSVGKSESNQEVSRKSSSRGSLSRKISSVASNLSQKFRRNDEVKRTKSDETVMHARSPLGGNPDRSHSDLDVKGSRSSHSTQSIPETQLWFNAMHPI